MDYTPTDQTGNHNPYRMLRNLSNSNPSLNKQPNVHVEYELSLPIDVSAYRHPPYTSLWNLNQRCIFTPLKTHYTRYITCTSVLRKL